MNSPKLIEVTNYYGGGRLYLNVEDISSVGQDAAGGFEMKTKIVMRNGTCYIVNEGYPVIVSKIDEQKKQPQYLAE